MNKIQAATWIAILTALAAALVLAREQSSDRAAEMAAQQCPPGYVIEWWPGQRAICLMKPVPKP